MLGCTITLADILITQGRLREATRAFEDALRLAADDRTLRGRADIHVGLSQIAVERNDIDAAERHLKESRQFRETAQNPYRALVVEARIREIRGDVDEALRLLDDAQRVYVGDFSPDVRPIAAMRIRMLTAHGRPVEGFSPPDDELSYRREFTDIALAGVIDEPVELLERLREAAGGGRVGPLIEILVRLAVARHDTAPLEQALELAEPEGYVRVFLDAGPPLVTLLRRLRLSPYARSLLAASGSVPPAQPTADPLSERDLDVLRLLATDLDGPGIARRLSVSLNTVRTHTRNVYAKLGVNSRRAAVRGAGEIGLL